MAVPKDKSELQNAIRTSYEKLTKEFQTIPLQNTAINELEGHSDGTMMSINNLLSYLLGWAELVLKWVGKKDLSETVNFPETGYKWNELGKLAQKFYQDYEHLDFLALKQKLEKTVNDILQMIEAKSNIELYEVCWYEKWTLGRMIQFNTSSPYTNARARIRKWKKENNLL